MRRGRGVEWVKSGECETRDCYNDVHESCDCVRDGVTLIYIRCKRAKSGSQRTFSRANLATLMSSLCPSNLTCG